MYEGENERSDEKKMMRARTGSDSQKIMKMKEMGKPQGERKISGEVGRGRKKVEK